MAEVDAEAEYVKHHPKKIAFIFSAMRHFADTIKASGWRVLYSKIDDPQNSHNIIGEVLRYAEKVEANELFVTKPGEWRLIELLENTPLKVSIIEDDRFIASHAEFENWAHDKKALRMEFFYREMRRKTGLLMDGDKPTGGKWNFDQENRKSPPKEIITTETTIFKHDEITEDVLALVNERYSSHFGEIYPFNYAVTPEDANIILDKFIHHSLPFFGDYQDAMMLDEPFLYHALISLYLNTGLLDPLETCRKVEEAFINGDAPLNAVEGFIRQIIGWREYIRGIYFLKGPGYTDQNYLKAKRKLPSFYWSADTKMRCVSQAVLQTKKHSYAHHIQRLMVTGNFALLADVDPKEVHQWYLSVYIDAFEWVEAPNTLGMSQFSDGGLVASKPYISSGAYINRMSNYCKNCHYDVKDKLGDRACPFNALYWDFLIRHKEKFSSNPRMAQMYRNWERQDENMKTSTLAKAKKTLAEISQNGAI
jgi:deoxyribodipyrimidine photolyase-related protein